MKRWRGLSDVCSNSVFVVEHETAEEVAAALRPLITSSVDDMCVHVMSRTV
jgi:hypothetical protein